MLRDLASELSRHSGCLSAHCTHLCRRFRQTKIASLPTRHLSHLASYPKVGFRHCKFVILAYVWGTWFSKVKRAERRCKKRSGLKLEACRRVGKWRGPGQLELIFKGSIRWHRCEMSRYLWSSREHWSWTRVSDARDELGTRETTTYTQEQSEMDMKCQLKGGRRFSQGKKR